MARQGKWVIVKSIVFFGNLKVILGNSLALIMCYLFEETEAAHVGDHQEIIKI